MFNAQKQHWFYNYGFHVELGIFENLNKLNMPTKVSPNKPVV